MGATSSQTVDVVSTTVRVTANGGKMLFPHVRLPGCFATQQVNSLAVHSGLDTIRSHIVAINERQPTGALCCWLGLSIAGVTVGFMCGFLMSFLGGVEGNKGVFGTGIAFVVLFVVSIVGLIYVAVRMGTLSKQLLDTANQELQPVLRTLNLQYRPFIQFSILSNYHNMLTITVTAGTQGKALPPQFLLIEPETTTVFVPPPQMVQQQYLVPQPYVPPSAPQFIVDPRAQDGGYRRMEGVPMSEPPPAYEEPAAVGLLCAACKHNNVPGSVFCARCGLRL